MTPPRDPTQSTHPSYSFMLLHPSLACCVMFSWIFPDSGSHPNLHQPKHSRLRMWWSEACQGEQGGIQESTRSLTTNAKKCKIPCTGKRKYFISMFLYYLMNSLNTIRCFPFESTLKYHQIKYDKKSALISLICLGLSPRDSKRQKLQLISPRLRLRPRPRPCPQSRPHLRPHLGRQRYLLLRIEIQIQSQ